MKRLYYFDYLRTFVIFLVICMHASLPYTKTVTDVIRWYIPQTNGYTFFDTIFFGLDIFIMPMMFFIAGYFTYPSWKKRSSFTFFKDKLVRIFLPFVLGCLLLNAFPNYIYALLNNATHENYLNYWWSTYAMHLQTMLSHSKASVHLWFLSFLFFFYLIYMLIHPLVHKVKSFKPTYFWISAFVAFIGFATINHFVKDYQPWHTYVDVITIQRTRAPLYLIYFILGIIYFRNKGSCKKAHLPFWLIYTTVMTALDLKFVVDNLPTITENTHYRTIHAFLHCFAAIGFLVLFLTFFERYCNRKNKLLSNFAQNSYAIYIIHFNIVIALQFALRNVPFSDFVKWPLIIIATSVGSYLITQGVLRRFSWMRRMLF